MIKKIQIALLLLLLCSISICQVSTRSHLYYSKEYSKEISLYRAKAFLIDQVLGSFNLAIKYSIDPLAATKSGELTSLSYQCDELKKQGLILGFYGDKWNANGVAYQAYAFKNLSKEKATELLNKLGELIKEHSKFLDADDNNNNVYFHYDDMVFLIYRDFTIKIRVFWEEFDSEWEMTAFKRTRKRLLKNLKD